MEVPVSGTARGNGALRWKQKDKIMRSGCLWLLGVPLPIIILLWLITGHA